MDTAGAAREVISVEGMGTIQTWAKAINGDALDFNGDGKAIPYAMEVVGTKVRITNPEPDNPGAMADLARFSADFSLVAVGTSSYEAELGMLAPLVQAAIDNASPTGAN